MTALREAEGAGSGASASEPTHVVLTRRADASSGGADASVLEPTGVVQSHPSGATSGGAVVPPPPTNARYILL